MPPPPDLPSRLEEPDVPLSFAQRTARLLTTRYALAIASVAVLSAAGQVLVQVALSRQAHDARVINSAGRQRNYSQALCKTVIAIRSLPPDAAADAWKEAEEINERWMRVHHGLLAGDALLDLPPNRSPVVSARYEVLEPTFRELERSIAQAIRLRTFPESEVAPLLAAQQRFLRAMEAVVGALDEEARERVHQTRILEATLFALLTLVLLAEVLFIFRPVVKRIRSEIEARERAEEAAIEREVAEVSGRLERRIGQDLHDGLGQLLTGISFQTKALQRRLGDGADAEAAAEITAQVGQAIGQTRSLARLLHPVEAEAESLGAAMHELGTIAERVFAVQAVVQWEEELPVPQARSETPDADTEGHDTPPSMHLYRIAQEAMSNAIRHGRAKHLWITGSVERGRATMIVADDGCGFDPPAITALHQHRTGMGLRIMAYRAERIGASYVLERRPEGGMRVTVSWAV